MHINPSDDVHKETAILVGVRWESTSSQVTDEYLDELSLLAETAGAEVLGRVVQARKRPDAATFLGKGKAQTLMRQATALDCDLIIVDEELSPTQQRNLQTLAGETIKIIDRSGLILDIFVRHARTREAKTQVELARLQYLLPRLSGQWTHLERQKGGIGTRGGPGETQIEVDRRIVRDRIRKLKSDLKQLAVDHNTRSKQRAHSYQVALVGYTNAGKSTLMNALTDAGVFVEDRLFATLDTTTRKLELGDHQPVLLSDTVGFIRKLPHHLIASFRTTLAEVAEADLIIKLLDASSPQVEDHLRTINDVLAELDVPDNPSLIVLNKVDALTDLNILARLKRKFPQALMVSARQRLRLETLEEAIQLAYSSHFRSAVLKVPLSAGKLIHEVYRDLEVKNRQDEEETATFEVQGPEPAIRAFQRRLEMLAQSG
jgi:GTP-binding protein HflX